MKQLFYICILMITMGACTPEIKGDPDRFKSGTFEVPGKEGIVSKTIISRQDSLQIERYTRYIEVSTDSGVFTKEDERIDTFYIEWKNNFFYTARMKSPRNDLDTEPMFYQITKVTDSSYNFTMNVGYSKFKQQGTVYKIK